MNCRVCTITQTEQRMLLLFVQFLVVMAGANIYLPPAVAYDVSLALSLSSVSPRLFR